VEAPDRADKAPPINFQSLVAGHTQTKLVKEALDTIMAWEEKELKQFIRAFKKLKKKKGLTLHESFEQALDALGGPAFLATLGLKNPGKFLDVLVRAQPKELNVKKDIRLIYVEAPHKAPIPVQLTEINEAPIVDVETEEVTDVDKH